MLDFLVRIAVSLVLCAGSGGMAHEPPASESGARILTESDAGATVRLARGERFSVSLHVQMGTGFRWLMKANPRLRVSEESVAGADRPGGSERQVFVMTAVESGTGVLAFEYRQPWAGPVPPQKEFSVVVEVDAH